MTRHRFARRLQVSLLAACLLAPALRAEDKPEAGKKPDPEATKPEQSVTQHSITIDGKAINYDATAGTLILRNDKGEPIASVGYVAYTQRGVADPATRPLTFSYNGGPGSSSIWLHMGAVGPRRVVTADAGPTPPPPYKTVDNTASVLDKTDLVMIDAIGTGISKAVGEAQDKDFWGVDPDIDAFSRFIKQYVSDNRRWNSPKFLLGESYGTTRSAGIVDVLQSRYNMAFNGVILVSVALDVEALFAWAGNDRPYPLILPSYAAVAAYHKLLPHAPPKLEPFLDEVRHFALGEYSAALAKGDRLTAAELDTIAAKLHDYTGVSADYWKKANLRVPERQYTQELLRDKRETVGRLDGRFLGFTFDQLSENAGYDPQSAAVSSAFTAAWMDYWNGDLKFGQGKNYRIQNGEVGQGWDWKHSVGTGRPAPTPNTGVDLGHAMGYNPQLKLLVLNGLYDLATPFFATEWVVDHLGLTAEQRQRVEMKYYDAGHMMYLNEAILKQFKADIGSFMDKAMHP